MFDRYRFVLALTRIPYAILFKSALVQRLKRSERLKWPRLGLPGMTLRKAAALAPNLYFREGYWLLLRSALLKSPCPADGFFLTEYDVHLKLAPSSAKKLGEAYSKPLKLKPELNQETGRWDLRIDLAKGGGGGAHHLQYHRLVGLTLKKAAHDADGRALQAPAVVSVDQWASYEVAIRKIHLPDDYSNSFSPSSLSFLEITITPRLR